MGQKHSPKNYNGGQESRASESPNGKPHQELDPNIVYIKGACKKNGRKGAQGGIGVYWGPGHDLNISDTYSGRQTNQRASLEAAIKGIEQAKAQNIYRLTVCTDNNIVIKGMTEWIVTWKKNGWKTSKNKDVVNKDLFAKLDSLTQDMNVDWKRVPVGLKVEGLVEAQRLARRATRATRK